MAALPYFHLPLDGQDDRVRVLCFKISELLRISQENPKALEIEAKLGFFHPAPSTKNAIVDELLHKMLQVEHLTLLPDPKRPHGGSAAYQFTSGLKEDEETQGPVIEFLFNRIKYMLQKEVQAFPQLISQTSSTTRDLVNEAGARSSYRKKGEGWEEQPFEVIKKDKKADINFKNTSKGPYVPRDFRISAQLENRFDMASTDVVVTERIKERTSFKMAFYSIELTKVTTLLQAKQQLAYPLITYEFEVELNSVEVQQKLMQKQMQEFEGIIKHFLAVVLSLSNALKVEAANFLNQQEKRLIEGGAQAYQEEFQGISPVVGDYLGQIALVKKQKATEQMN